MCLPLPCILYHQIMIYCILQGCTKGFHNPEKPKLPEKQVEKPLNPDEVIIYKPTRYFCLCKVFIANLMLDIFDFGL